jgi:hypothetical protein
VACVSGCKKMPNHPVLQIHHACCDGEVRAISVSISDGL